MKKDCNSGFSLVEICIVVMIVGLVTIPLFQLYQSVTIGQDKNITEENVTTIMTELGRFQQKTDLGTGANGLQTARLPCPSDRSLPSYDSAGYLREFNAAPDGHGRCSVAELAAMPAPLTYDPSNPGPVCTLNGGFCIVRGEKTDTAGVTTYAPVLVGGLPLRAMNKIDGYNIPENTILDGWASQFTYAVTLSLASGGTYALNKGYISVIDENGNPTAGIKGDGDYLIFSHGPNRMSGFSKEGQLISACGTAPYGIAREVENCDNDATFIQALTGSYRQINTSAYYDDLLNVSKIAFGNIWAYTINSAGATTSSIYNVNLKSVGVKTSTPTAKIEVAAPSSPAGMEGTVRASHNVKASMVCNKDGSNCFKISAIAGTAFVSCGINQVMTGVYTDHSDPNNPVTRPNCVTLSIPSKLSPLPSCPTGQYLHGFLANGVPVCK